MAEEVRPRSQEAPASHATSWGTHGAQHPTHTRVPTSARCFCLLQQVNDSPSREPGPWPGLQSPERGSRLEKHSVWVKSPRKSNQPRATAPAPMGRALHLLGSEKEQPPPQGRDAAEAGLPHGRAAGDGLGAQAAHHAELSAGLSTWPPGPRRQGPLQSCLDLLPGSLLQRPPCCVQHKPAGGGPGRQGARGSVVPGPPLPSAQPQPGTEAPPWPHLAALGHLVSFLFPLSSDGEEDGAAPAGDVSCWCRKGGLAGTAPQRLAAGRLPRGEGADRAITWCPGDRGDFRGQAGEWSQSALEMCYFGTRSELESAEMQRPLHLLGGGGRTQAEAAPASCSCASSRGCPGA